MGGDHEARPNKTLCTHSNYKTTISDYIKNLYIRQRPALYQTCVF